MANPLYPDYLPTRPDGYSPTLDVPLFEADEPGTRADPTTPSILKAGATITNITPIIGTEIRGIQLSKLTHTGLDEVAFLAAQRGVLVFREQDFADIGFEKQKEVVKYYGPLHKHPTMGYPAGTGPEFHVVYADEKAGNLRTLLGPHTTYDLWHVDQTFTPNVPSTTFFWVLEIPASGGGDTAFTSLTAAYEALSPAFRELLGGLSLYHTSASVGEVARVGMERALKEAVNTTHPLVIRHPVTRKPSLFVNPTIARKIEGFLPEESDNLLKFLHDHFRSLDFSCRVKWEKGTVVVWDQRAAAHSAVPDFADGERRHMLRMIPYGTKPQPAFPEKFIDSK
ncbi:taurine catabolism dioxygenase [Hypoxylon trugodes]|uniref:taurine catabolism dioxygenase n=1 Tax=Hypoxylon trugodes TaxID=326681 RepID=UPI002197A0CB|nr:taurine catabolism dioxygenase [Hypoxylon trugodes]KAI1385127.1 taurine catabolism dioxygenase [Hypoxylon trugodes]